MSPWMFVYHLLAKLYDHLLISGSKTTLVFIYDIFTFHVCSLSLFHIISVNFTNIGLKLILNRLLDSAICQIVYCIRWIFTPLVRILFRRYSRFVRMNFLSKCGCLPLGVRLLLQCGLF